MQYTEITNIAGSEVEGVWTNIHCDKQHLALGVMYRPPSSNKFRPAGRCFQLVRPLRGRAGRKGGLLSSRALIRSTEKNSPLSR